MKAWIMRDYGDYILKYRSRDLEELRRIATIIKKKLGIDFKDVKL